MCNGQACLGYGFLAIVGAFSVLIYVLLKTRKGLLAENRTLTADQIWADVAARASHSHLARSDLLFGVWGDASATVKSLVVKNAKDEIVGEVLYPLGAREINIKLGNESFVIELPLAWNRTAVVRNKGSGKIIAKYRQTRWLLDKHEYDVSGVGVLKSERPKLSRKAMLNYRLGEKVYGVYQEISAVRMKGRLVVLPSDLPLSARVFILAM